MFKKIGIVLGIIILLFSWNNNSVNASPKKVANTKKAALEILKSTVKLDKDYEFTNAAIEEGKSGYKWDDGSYYTFTQRDKKTGDMGDISSIYLVKKNTRDIYQLDLQKDPSGNTLKKYQK